LQPAMLHPRSRSAIGERPWLALSRLRPSYLSEVMLRLIAEPATMTQMPRNSLSP
jgi:hypothetical protein